MLKEPPTRIQSVARAVQLLVEATAPGGTTTTEAARAVGIAVPTAHHLLSTLEDEGMLARTEGKRFVIGPRVAVLAGAFLRDGTPPSLRGPLLELAETTGETAYLSAWRDGRIHAIESIEGGGALRVAGVERGVYRLPHARATGKLLLALADPATRDALLGEGELEAATARTITDRAALGRELQAIAARGWAEDRGEFVDGVCCVSAPALADGAVVAAYTVSAPADRYAARREQLLAAVRRAAETAVP